MSKEPIILIIVVSFSLGLAFYWEQVDGWSAASIFIAFGALAITWQQYLVANVANDLASAANDTAIKAIKLAKDANDFSGIANTLANSANSIAKTANTIAISAHKYGHEGESVKQVEKSLRVISGVLLQIEVWGYGEKGGRPNMHDSKVKDEFQNEIKEFRNNIIAIDSVLTRLPDSFKMVIKDLQKFSLFIPNRLNDYLNDKESHLTTIKSIRSEMVKLFSLCSDYWDIDNQVSTDDA